MTEITKTETLKKLNHLEKIVEMLSEEIKEMKSSIQKKNFSSLCGILKGIKISEKDIAEAKKSLFKKSIEA